MFDVLEKAYDDDLVENGSWLHFTGPDGEPMYLDPERTKPARARVRSMLSKKYDEHMDRLQAGATTRARKMKGEEQRRKLLLKEMKDNQPKACAALVAEFENVSVEQPGTIRPSESDLMAFATQPKNKVWVDQILEHAADNANYGADAGKDLGDD